MKNGINLETILAQSAQSSAQQQTLFALLTLGIIESLGNGLLSAADAPVLFFNAGNCGFVRRRLRGKLADQIMSHGVQLPDLFEALPAEEAQREFQHELSTMRLLCLKLLEGKRLVA
jgi:hypothetical protein